MLAPRFLSIALRDAQRRHRFTREPAAESASATLWQQIIPNKTRHFIGGFGMRGAFAGCMIALGLLWGTAALAGTSDDGTDDNESPKSLERTISANANFTDSVAIAVPPFHGLEPSLGLTYGSGAGNGFVGVGWRLSGLSAIERASVRFGTPRYDNSDVFVWDGAELVDCTGITSPSCSTGGTHTTHDESYVRIKRITGAPADQWE